MGQNSFRRSETTSYQERRKRDGSLISILFVWSISQSPCNKPITPYTFISSCEGAVTSLSITLTSPSPPPLLGCFCHPGGKEGSVKLTDLVFGEFVNIKYNSDCMMKRARHHTSGVSISWREILKFPLML